MSPGPPKASEIAASLDADARLLPFLPALLADLPALGFDPEPMVELLRASPLARRRDVTMLDLGCGKGAALLRLAREFGWGGTGVDLMPEFVAEARRLAEEQGLSAGLRFEVADIALAARAGPPADLLLYCHDGDALGSLGEALAALRLRLNGGGHLLLDTVWARGPDPAEPTDPTRPTDPTGPTGPTECSIRRAVRGAGLDVAGEMRLDPGWVRSQNRANTERIRRRAVELGRLHPDKGPWFDDYVRRQEEESRRLEEDLVCSLLLLERRDLLRRFRGRGPRNAQSPVELARGEAGVTRDDVQWACAGSRPPDHAPRLPRRRRTRRGRLGGLHRRGAHRGGGDADAPLRGVGPGGRGWTGVSEICWPRSTPSRLSTAPTPSGSKPTLPGPLPMPPEGEASPPFPRLLP